MNFGRRSTLFLLLGILILSLPTDAEAFFFRRLFGGVRARRAARFALPRQRFLINPNFFTPSVVNCLNAVGGFGHGGGSGIDPRLCFLDPALANPFIGALGNDFGRGGACGQFRGDFCPSGGTAWACAAQNENGFAVEASGNNGCWAQANVQWEACRAGVDPSLVPQLTVACWKKGGPQLGAFDTGNGISGQAVISWNWGDESWGKLKGWLEKKGLSFTRFQGKNKVIVNVAAGGEADFCNSAISWNSGLVQFCSPNLFNSTAGAGMAGVGQFPGNQPDGTFGVKVRNPFDFAAGIGAGLQ